MSPCVVVVVEPWLQSLGAFVVVGVDLPVCPFDLEGPVEALYLAVLPWAMGADAYVIGVEGLEDSLESVALGVGPVVVGHHRFDTGDSMGGEELGGSGHEPCRGVALFVGEYLRIGPPGVIVDGGVDVVVADPGFLFGRHLSHLPSPGPPAASLGDTTDLFDVHMDEFTGTVPFVSGGCGLRYSDHLSLSSFLCEVVIHVVGSRRPGKLIANALSACFQPWVPVPSSPPLVFPMFLMAR